MRSVRSGRVHGGPGRCDCEASLMLKLAAKLACDRIAAEGKLVGGLRWSGKVQLDGIANASYGKVPDSLRDTERRGTRRTGAGASHCGEGCDKRSAVWEFGTVAKGAVVKQGHENEASIWRESGRENRGGRRSLRSFQGNLRVVDIWVILLASFRPAATSVYRAAICQPGGRVLGAFVETVEGSISVPPLQAEGEALKKGRSSAELVGDSAVAGELDNAIKNRTKAEGGDVAVSATAAESSIENKRIGDRIKYLRQRKRMGLVELGKHTGLSASFLSQLETGRVVPTLRNLARIAMVFSKDLSYFFEPERPELFRILRSGERQRLPQTGAQEPGYYFESLGQVPSDQPIAPYVAEFLPSSGGRLAKAHQHTGNEFLYVLDGRLQLAHDGKVEELEGGDAVFFNAEAVHSYESRGDKSCTALILTMPEALRGAHSGAKVPLAPKGNTVVKK